MRLYKAFIGSVLLLTAGSAYCCEFSPTTREDSFKNADYVFRAVVTGIHIEPQSTRSIDPAFGIDIDSNKQITFITLKDIKGNSSNLKHITTGWCSEKVTIGRVYFFFVDEQGYTNMGSGNILAGANYLQIESELMRIHGSLNDTQKP